MAESRGNKYEIILNAAIEAFAKYGFHQCQVSKIAKHAGVADGTIYLYFKNKEEILIKLFEEGMGEFIKLMRENLESCTTTRERLQAIIDTHFSYMEDNRSLAIVTQFELRQPNHELRNAISGPLKDYLRLIEEVIEEGIRSKEIPPLNVRIARQVIFGSIDEVTTNWVFGRVKRSLKEDSTELLNLLAGALKLPLEVF